MSQRTQQQQISLQKPFVSACTLWWLIYILDEMEPGLVAMIRAYLEGLFEETRGYYIEESAILITYIDPLSGKYYMVSTILDQDIFAPRVLSHSYSPHYRACAVHVPGDFSYDSTMIRVSVSPRHHSSTSSYMLPIPLTLSFSRPRPHFFLMHYNQYRFREHNDIVSSKRLFQKNRYEDIPTVRRTKIQKGGMRMRGNHK